LCRGRQRRGRNARRSRLGRRLRPLRRRLPGMTRTSGTAPGFPPALGLSPTFPPGRYPLHKAAPPVALARAAPIRYFPPSLTNPTGVRRLAGRKGPTVTVTVRQLAEWVRGEVLGDAELPISNART